MAKNYRLEVWGAQGGGAGGKGGHSCGYKNIESQEELFICVGGEGKPTAGRDISSTSSCGGYNGGGNAQVMEFSWGGAGGGGATHIAITNNRGVLANYVNNKNEVLIVAGGGGAKDGGLNAGDGGGFFGTNGANKDDVERSGEGGTQDSGGNGGNDGTFGKGGDVPIGPVTIMDSGGAGGGGWYGGGSTFIYWSASGGGGSGYIGGVTNGTMQTGVQSGNGKAVITWHPNV